MVRQRPTASNCFQREAHRVDEPMTTGASDIRTMLGQALADGEVRRYGIVA